MACQACRATTGVVPGYRSCPSKGPDRNRWEALVRVLLKHMRPRRAAFAAASSKAVVLPQYRHGHRNLQKNQAVKTIYDRTSNIIYLVVCKCHVSHQLVGCGAGGRYQIHGWKELHVEPTTRPGCSPRSVSFFI